MAQRKRSTDLFPTNRPVSADRMIGRDADVGALAAHLGNGQHRALIGARRTGKTTVCDAALERLQADGVYVVSVDLFRLESAAELAEAVARAAVSNRPAVRRVVPRLKRSGRHALDALSATARAKMATEFGSDIEIVFAPGLASTDPQRHLAYAFGLLETIAQADDVQLVLFLDEFQDVASAKQRFGESDVITKQLRATLQRSPRVTALFAGSIESMMRDLFNSRQRALYQFAGMHSLAPIPPDDWRVGLTERFSEDGCVVTPGALDLLLEHTGGHPRATMLVCQHAHNAAIVDARETITEETMAVGYALAREDDWELHQDLANEVRQISSTTMTILRRVAAGTAYSTGMHGATANRSIEALARRGLIEQPTARTWHVIDPLFGAFILDL